MFAIHSDCFSIQCGRSCAFHERSLPKQRTLLRLSGENSDATAPLKTESSKQPAASSPVLKCPNCDLCDGSGRIIGGIGILAPWWPIKAYRPCPKFINSGGLYERAGQGLEEIAFGRED